ESPCWYWGGRLPRSEPGGQIVLTMKQLDLQERLHFSERPVGVPYPGPRVRAFWRCLGDLWTFLFPPTRPFEGVGSLACRGDQRALVLSGRVVVLPARSPRGSATTSNVSRRCRN